MLEDVCGVFQKEGEREPVSGVLEDKEREASAADLLFKRRCMEIRALSCGEDGVLG